MTISQEILEWLRKEPITEDKGMAFTKGLYKIPSSFSEAKKFIKFVKIFDNYYK